MEVLEWPNGICPQHGEKLSVNGIPTCVKCKAAAERASRPPAPVVTVADPGHDAMKAIVPDGQHVPVVPRTAVVRDGQQSVSNGQQAIPPISRQLGAIRDAIYGLPMPKSLRQYKRFQRIQQLIDQAVEDENAEAD